MIVFGAAGLPILTARAMLHLERAEVEEKEALSIPEAEAALASGGRV